MESGWNVWVWLLGVVVRRYIDFLILLIPAKIIVFSGDTNYINHAQIRYVWEIKHSPSCLALHLPYVPIGHGLCNTLKTCTGIR